MPYKYHPLTRAYIAGTRVTDQRQLWETMRIIQGLELMVTAQEKAACKLVAEVLIERNEA